MANDLIFKEAEAHFRKHGDAVQFKTGGNPNASYEVIRGELTCYAYGRTRDWQDAEDAVQEAYTRMLEQQRYPDGRNFGGLFKVILDACIADQFRRDKAREHIQEEDYYDPENEGLSLVDLMEGDELEPAKVLEIQEKVNFIMNTSNRMSQKAKGIIRMSLIFGYTNAEIARTLGIPVKKVSNTLVYFRKKLEKWEN
ncbi:MAG: RNA polymerase sigma factor [Planctomycetes bacterium]|nr:RNA polymerase sigma factor [Planctomycetota bacterium]